MEGDPETSNHLTEEQFDLLQKQLEEMDTAGPDAAEALDEKTEEPIVIRSKEEMVESWVQRIRSNDISMITLNDIFGGEVRTILMCQSICNIHPSHNTEPQSEMEKFSEDEVDSSVPFRISTAYQSGGVLLCKRSAKDTIPLTNTLLAPEIIAKQRNAFWNFVKTLGKSIYTKGLLNTSLPVELFEPRSFTERFVDCWAFAPIFLTKAARTKNARERMEYTAAFVVSGLHKMLMVAKPFNPILGETFQASFPDGSRIYTEQVSHHPPITAWQLFGARNEYQFYGQSDFTYSFHGNATGVRQIGQCAVVFASGGKITFKYPQYYCSGVVWGDTVVEVMGQCQFHDVKNKILCDIKFNPEGGFTKMVSGWFSRKEREDGEESLLAKQRQVSDFLEGEIYHYSKDSSGNFVKEEVLSSLEGSWLGYMNFTEVQGGNVKRVWDIRSTAENAARPTPVPNPLPSDCRFRLDMLYLADNNIPKAAEEKKRLEERQREHRKLRASAREEKMNERLEKILDKNAEVQE